MTWWKWSCLAIPVLGASELIADLALANRAPTQDEWRQAKPLLDELRQQTELVVVAPRWAEPQARAAFGQELMPISHVARADVAGHSRAIEVSILGQASPELGNFRLVDERRDGKFRLRTYENPDYRRPLYDFVEQLGPKSASVDYWVRDVREPCPFSSRAKVRAGGLHGPPAYPRERFECNGPEWLFVGVTIIDDEEYRPRRCIWSHPGASGPIATTFRDVPLGRRIVGHAGLPYFFSREGKGAPVTLEVRVDDASVGSFVHHDATGWQRFEFATGDRAGTRGNVTFRVSADDADARQFCYAARSEE